MEIKRRICGQVHESVFRPGCLAGDSCRKGWCQGWSPHARPSMWRLLPQIGGSCAHRALEIFAAPARWLRRLRIRTAHKEPISSGHALGPTPTADEASRNDVFYRRQPISTSSSQSLHCIHSFSTPRPNTCFAPSLTSSTISLAAITSFTKPTAVPAYVVILPCGPQPSSPSSMAAS